MNPLWIDSDGGADDLISLILAVKNNLDIVGISSVFGITDTDHAFDNLRNVLSLLHREDIEVYKGVNHPLNSDHAEFSFHRGINGISDVALIKSKAMIQKMSASKALYQKALKYKGDLEIMAIGPLSNIAECIREYPDFKSLISRIYIMGGTFSKGNIREFAEFNIYKDPDSAKLVFDTIDNIDLFPLDLTSRSALYKEDIKNIISIDNKLTKLFKDIYSLSEETDESFSLTVHDACAIYCMINNNKLRYKFSDIDVETKDKETPGKTTMKDGKRHRVFLDLDRNEFVSCLKDAFV